MLDLQQHNCLAQGVFAAGLDWEIGSMSVFPNWAMRYRTTTPPNKHEDIAIFSAERTLPVPRPNLILFTSPKVVWSFHIQRRVMALQVI